MTTVSSPPLKKTHDATWFAVKGPNGDLTWRVDTPAWACDAKLNYIPDKDGGKGLMWPNDGTDFAWAIHGEWEDGSEAHIETEAEWKLACEERRKLLNMTSEYKSLEGRAAVFTRPLSWLAAHMMEMRSQGIRVCAEVDDNYLSKAKHNIFTTKWVKTVLTEEGSRWEDYGEDHSRSICVGDGLILSTDKLRDQYWKYLTSRFKKKDLPEFFVCRNHVDRRFLPDKLVPARQDGKLRIGYMGSDSHYWDVELIYPALKEAYDQGHEVVFIGIDPRYSMIEPSAYEIKTRQHWWNIEFTHIPWSDTFRGVALPLDIGFAPLVQNHSTDGKSDIKWMEYAISGAACVAQNSVVYNRTAKHGENVLFANSPTEFVLQMRELIRNPRLRRDLAGATMEYIEKERMIENNRDEWRQAVYG